jgi:hypothetical protein
MRDKLFMFSPFFVTSFLVIIPHLLNIYTCNILVDQCIELLLDCSLFYGKS